jgi:two-component system sporulation sensor kinase B
MEMGGCKRMEDIVRNLFYIIFPLFLFQTFGLERYCRMRKGKFFGVLAITITIVLSKIDPIYKWNGYFFGLHEVALILGILYLGKKLGIYLLIVLFATNYYISGFEMYQSLISTVLLFAVLLPLSKYFLLQPIRKKIMIVSSLTIINFLIETSIYSFIHWQWDMGFVVFGLRTFLLQLISVILILLFINTLVKNFKVFEGVAHTEKMDIVSQLAASVSHEVRNPLTVSRGFIQLLMEDGLSNEKKQQFLNLAIDEIDRAKEIINDYLTFAKPSIKKEQFLDLREEIQYVIDTITPMANMYSIPIKTKIYGSGVIKGDRAKLRQCFINIIKNSIEAMEHGGILTIETYGKPNEIEIVINDTGKGMTEEELSRLGEPYFSTKERGTGLGMMVVYRIIEAMGGRMAISSKLGEGTTFKIYLPNSENTR